MRRIGPYEIISGASLLLGLLDPSPVQQFLYARHAPAGGHGAHPVEHLSTVMGRNVPADCVRFLWHLLRHTEGPLTVLWDGLPPHRGQAVRAFLATQHGGRVHLEVFPAYAPELSPDEGVWKQLKYVELGSVCCQRPTELKQALRLAIERLRQKPYVIRGCFQQCGFV